MTNAKDDAPEQAGGRRPTRLPAGCLGLALLGCGLAGAAGWAIVVVALAVAATGLDATTGPRYGGIQGSWRRGFVVGLTGGALAVTLTAAVVNQRLPDPHRSLVAPTWLTVAVALLFAGTVLAQWLWVWARRDTAARG